MEDAEAATGEQKADYDGAWKEALNGYLRPFLELCFPVAANDIDWTREVEWLDKELQEVIRDSDLGKQRVDKLVKVWRKNGTEERVLIHIEVQSDRDANLPTRLYRYHHRLVDHYGFRVATLVVLGDQQISWLPGPYVEALWGCSVHFNYPVCKLLELEAREDRPLEQRNPAAIFIAAYLAAKRSHGNMNERQKLKWDLIRRLYKDGYSKSDTLALFRVVDWMVALPQEKEVELRTKILKYENKNMTPYLTSIERFAIEKGREKGLEEGREKGLEQGREEGLAYVREIILDILLNRFGKDLPPEIPGQLDAIQNVQRLKELQRHALRCDTLEDFKVSLPHPEGGESK